MLSKIFSKMHSSVNVSHFGLFWSGRYKALSKRYDDAPEKFRDAPSCHYAFAAKAILDHRVDQQLLSSLEQPLTKDKFLREFDQAIAAEIAMPGGSVISQPSKLRKSHIVARIALENEIEICIETGTYIGASSLNIAPLFKHLYTVEASIDLYKASQVLFEMCKASNITGANGNSYEFLRDLGSDIISRSVIFLDAHYSTGITSRQFGVCPLMQELQVIFASNLLVNSRGPVVVIDDIRDMTGKKGYPNLHEILGMIPVNWCCTVAFDQLIISKPGVVLSFMNQK